MFNFKIIVSSWNIFKGYDRGPHVLKLIYKTAIGVQERILALNETVKLYCFVSANCLHTSLIYQDKVICSRISQRTEGERNLSSLGQNFSSLPTSQASSNIPD